MLKTFINPVIDLEKTDFEKVSQILSNIPNGIGWKDQHARFICANQQGINALGYSELDQIIGLTVRNAKGKIVETADQLIANDLYAMQQKKACKQIVSYFDKDNNWCLNLSLQQPLFDLHHNVIGVSNVGIRLLNTPLADKFAWLFLNENAIQEEYHQGVYKANNEFEQWQLSDREAEYLFFLLRGKNLADIRVLLKVSTKQLNKSLDLICYRFGVASIEQLIDRARDFKLHECIPEHWCQTF
ncbi:MAG TPA: hypothetical protein VHE99_02695 [Gammaproteobacteria bacterium]|nr:hypothetical protein [Gammaproteobacteria bacterium]